MIGRELGHYRILEKLGAGGMGVVYKALDSRLNRHVALKLLPPLESGEEVERRFLQEARAASALDHRAICTVHAIEATEDGRPYIVMAFYEGQTLAERLSGGPMAPREVVELTRQVGEGLAEAHAQGIIHRDIKPSNLFVTTRGEAKILDFGIAKISGASRITRTGASMGTLSYIAPEQLRGADVDARADIWSLGAVIYEMLTGRVAFAADSEGGVVYAILEAAFDPPSRVRPGVPAQLDRVVDRALRRERRERYATVGELLEDLDSERALGEAQGEGFTSAPTRSWTAARAPRERSAESDLEAFEYCAKGRQEVLKMTPEGFSEGEVLLAKALELDPDYAHAHATLGQLHALRFIGTTHPDALDDAIRHLERAVELDPELALPHCWLTYCLARKGRFDDAVRAGKRSLELDPGDAFAHYFLASAYWLQIFFEFRGELRAEAIRLLRRTVELAPRFQSAHQVLGDLHLQLGDYREAEGCFRRAAEIEASDDWEMVRFVGAEAMLGRLLAHWGRRDEAWRTLHRSLESLARTDHVYTAAFRASTHCALGEVALQRNEPGEALPFFRRAGEEADGEPRALGIGWFRVRSWIGAAKCFLRLQLRREASELEERARGLLEAREEYDFSGVWGGGEAEIRYELASLEAVAHRDEEAVAELRRAVECGWREVPRLAHDLGLKHLLEAEELRALVREIEGTTGRDG